MGLFFVFVFFDTVVWEWILYTNVHTFTLIFSAKCDMAGACILSFITRATHETSSIIVVLCKASALLFLFLNSMRVQCCDSSSECAQYISFFFIFRLMLVFYLSKKQRFILACIYRLIAVVMLYACFQGFNHAIHINSMYINLCE